MIFLNIRIALAALRSARVRTMLTMAGIVVGVASVTLIMALGEGIKRQVSTEVDKLGTNVVQIRPGKATGEQSLSLNFFGGAAPSTLTERDYQTVLRTTGVAAAAPVMAVPGNVGHDGKELAQPLVIATTEKLPQTVNVPIGHGEFLNPEAQARTAVIGHRAAKELLGTDNQIGGKIQVHGEDYTVIGVLKENSVTAAFGGVTPDLGNAVFIPFEAGKQAYGNNIRLQEITVKVAAKSDTQSVIADLQKAIRHNHNGQEDFAVLTQADALQTTHSIISVLTTFTAAIAAISLLVGGIGIMNIMLVSVTERTREIGIRKSIGATNGQILGQFLVESMVISIGGGLIGLALAYGLTGLAALRFELAPVITLSTVGWAFGVSTAIGIIFGVAPALKAARKDPIEALRHG